jgi:atypical dual specificity phosphatase
VSRWFEVYGFAEVADGLWAGAYPTDAEDVAEVAALGVDHVMNLCEDDEYEADERDVVEAELAEAGVEETRVCVVDYGALPRAELELAVESVVGWLEAGETAYLHCRAGWQRSATVAAGVIARREGVEPEEALRRLAERKPTADPLPHQRKDLLDWWAARCA